MKYSPQLTLNVMYLVVSVRMSCQPSQQGIIGLFFFRRTGIEKTAEIWHNVYSGIIGNSLRVGSCLGFMRGKQHPRSFAGCMRAYTK